MIQTTIQRKKVIDSITQYAKVNNLRAGDKLPPIRNIAEEFGFAQVTVAQAIKSLAEEGFVESRTKVGTTLIKDLTTMTTEMPPNIIQVTNRQGVYKVLEGIWHVLPDAEIMQACVNFARGEAALEEMLCRHYALKKDKNRTFFVLGNCPAWVKTFFEKQQLPVIVIGGVEEGISLPNVCVDPIAVIEEVKKLLDRAKAYPTVFLMEEGEILGSHRYYYEHIHDITNGQGAISSVVRLTDKPDIRRTQLASLLDLERRPRTFILQGDDAAGQIIRLCRERNIRIPEDLYLISLESSSVGELLIPSITSVYHDYIRIGESVGYMLQGLMNGQKPTYDRSHLKPLIVYRESFPDPSEG